MERSGIVSIFENFTTLIAHSLLICGNWYEKLHIFGLKLSEFFKFFFNDYPLICGNWCEKLHTF